MLRFTYILLLIVMAMAWPAKAVVVTFDTMMPTSGVGSDSSSTDRSGALTELFIAFPDSDFTVTITRDSGARFDLVDNMHPRQTGKADYYGSNVSEGDFRSISLDPFADTSNRGFIFTFNEPINVFSVRMGDFGGDADYLHVFGFSGPSATGNVVNNGVPEARDLWPNEDDPKAWTDKRITLRSTDKINSVLVTGGVGDMSVFLDRIYFDRHPLGPDGTQPLLILPFNLDSTDNPGTPHFGAIPEPGSLAILTAFALFGIRRRR